MRRWIGKIWIDWLLDDQESLPKWLARWVAQDPVLRSHWEGQRRLVERLQRSAAVWSQQQATNPSLRAIPSGGMRKDSPALPHAWGFRFGLAMTVALFFFVSIWIMQGDESEIPNPQPIAVHVPPRVEHQKVLDPQWVESASRGWKQWEQKGRDAQLAARDFLVKLDQDMLSEQKLFVSDLRSAAEYFTVVLPDRTASLVGLD